MTGSSNESDFNDFHSEFDGQFTNVPNLAHQTKTPSSRAVPQIPQLQPEDTPDYSDYSNSYHQHTEFTGINIDDAIKDKIVSSMAPAYDDRYSEPQYDSYSVPESSQYEELQRVDFYTDISKMEKKESDLPVLLPIRSDLFESYLSPLFMIFSQIPSFSNLVLRHEFLTFSYKPNWWNREKCSENLLLIQEVQRLVAFLNGDTIRAFASIFNLENCISKLVKEEFENVNEFFDFFIEELKLSLKQINPNFAESMDNLFQMTLVQEQENEDRLTKHDVYNIPIHSETIASDIYYVLYNSFTQSRQLNDPSTYIWIETLPTVLSLFFEPGLDDIEGGYELAEEFYPQIFTYAHKNIIADIENEIAQIRKLQREASKKTFGLRAFQGKNINGFLSESKTYLKKSADALNVNRESEDVITEGDKIESASENIAQISMQIKNAIKNIDQQTREMSERLAYLESNKLDINTLLDEDTKATFEPWILIGVILTHNHFFYRVKKQDKWIGVAIDDETCKAYETRNVDFSFIQSTVCQYTEADFGDGMTLIYIKKSEFYLPEFTPLNKILKDFIDKDNKKLKEQLDFWNASNADAKIDLENNKDDESDKEPSILQII